MLLHKLISLTSRVTARNFGNKNLPIGICIKLSQADYNGFDHNTAELKTFSKLNLPQTSLQKRSGLSVVASLSADDMPVADPANCKHFFFEKWGPNHYHCTDCHETLGDENRIKDEERISESTVDDSVPEHGVNRGVTIQFLYDFANACNCWDMTTRDVRRKFVMPATRARRCRFVELPEMADVVGRATTFVSHAWGAKFGDLVAALCDGNADMKRVVWLDIFAVRQWPSAKPDFDFSAVVRLCKSLLIVCSSLPEISKLDEFTVASRDFSTIPSHIRYQVAFLRVWCLVEVRAAVLNGLIIVMKGGSHSQGEKFVSDPEMLLKLFFLIDIESAEATIAADREKLLSDIRIAEGGVSGVNGAIRGLLVGARTAASHPLVQCAACGDRIALEKLLQAPSKYIVAVSSCGYVELLNRVIDFGADVNTVTNSTTSLIAAAFGGHLACIELLIQNGADVTFKLFEGDTAVMAAATGGHTNCVELLGRSGCDVMATNNAGLTALVMSAMGGHTACCESLIRLGSNVAAASPIGVTALMFVAGLGHVDTMELLVKHGSDVNISADDGMTALMVAAKEGRTRCVELLLNCGSDVNASSEFGATALIYAASEGHTRCVELLLKNYSNANLRMSNGETAMDCALKGGHDDVTKLLCQNSPVES